MKGIFTRITQTSLALWAQMQLAKDIEDATDWSRENCLNFNFDKKNCLKICNFHDKKSKKANFASSYKLNHLKLKHTSKTRAYNFQENHHEIIV